MTRFHADFRAKRSRRSGALEGQLPAVSRVTRNQSPPSALGQFGSVALPSLHPRRPLKPLAINRLARTRNRRVCGRIGWERAETAGATRA